MLDVVGQQPLEVALIQDDYMVEALLAERPDHPLGDACRLGTTAWAGNSLAAERSRPPDEAFAEDRVPVGDGIAGKGKEPPVKTKAHKPPKKPVIRRPPAALAMGRSLVHDASARERAGGVW